MLIRLLLLSIIPLLLFASTDRSLQRMKIEQRVALVIGNNKYDSEKLSNLRNPINDARAMKKKLQNLGFKVFYGENLTKRQMDKKLDKFSQKLSNGGVGLFFFAGHGIEYKRENYLMAKNSSVDDKNDVKYESLPLLKILDTMQDSGNRLNIVLLDACRNDPFSRSGGGGLAKSTAKGTFIVYATSPGDVASDGSGKHGAFTSQILKHIDANGVSIERVFKRVKIGVINSTQQNQRPWVSNDITGDFYFKLPTGKKIVVTPTKVKTIKSTKVNSSFSFKEATSTKFSLTINTTPNNARVQITNIQARYKDGIKLKKGTYKIKISKLGFKTKNGNIDLQTDMSIEVNLQKTAKVTSTLKSTYSGLSEVKPISNRLMWQDNYEAMSIIMTWQEAIIYCKKLKLNGYDNWKLPNIDELKSIVDNNSRGKKGKIKKEFTYSTDGNYWSSSLNSSLPKYAWGVEFKYGYAYDYGDKNGKVYVRCVRKK